MQKKIVLRNSIAGLLFFLLLLSILIWQNNQSIHIRRLADENEVFEKIEILEEWQERMTLTGTTIQRSVRVMNASEVPVFVRASFEEVLRYIAPDSEEAAFEQAADASDAPDLLPVLSRFDENEILARGYQNVTQQIPELIGNALDGQVMVWISDETIEELAPTPALDDFDSEEMQELLGELDAEGQDNPENFYDHTEGNEEMEEQPSSDLIDGPPDLWQEPVLVEAHFSYSFRRNQQPVMQKMSGELLLLNPADPVAEWTFEAANLTYSYYLEGYRYFVRNWAESQLASPFSTNEEPTGFTYLGEQGTIDQSSFDYTTTESGLGSAFQLPEMISAFPDAAGLYPTQTVKTLSSFVSESPAQIDSEAIMIEFGSLSDYRQIDRNTWIYNPDDGWFYYSFPLDRSYQSEDGYGVTRSLIEQVMIDTSVADDSHLAYELLPKVEVIQASDRQSLKEVFQLDNDRPESATAIIYRHLYSLQ